MIHVLHQSRCGNTYVIGDDGERRLYSLGVGMMSTNSPISHCFGDAFGIGTDDIVYGPTNPENKLPEGLREYPGPMPQHQILRR